MSRVVFLVLAVSAVASDDFTFPEVSDMELVGASKLNFLSATLGDHMVLQRAPQQAMVWGHTTAGATVTTTFNGITLSSKAEADGTWRHPATAASTKAYTLTFEGSAGESASLNDVLFGDVFICSGQSNMQFAIANASEEIQMANAYPLIRLFTVGQKTSSKTPLNDLQTIQQNWSVTSNTTIAGGGGFGYFSAVCWIFGRTIFDKLGGKVPLGLVNNNWVSDSASGGCFLFYLPPFFFLPPRAAHPWSTGQRLMHLHRAAVMIMTALSTTP
jgi:hypothetical protein